MKRLALFASGEGTNAEAIINYFKNNSSIEVVALFCDRKHAPVLDKARLLGIPAILFSKKAFYETDDVLNLLIEKKTDLIVLAGFLKLIPKKIIDRFPGKIVNIHPALLPAYGGKGMYGMKVHEEVFKNQGKETGITIHYVNENFDEGEIVFQKKRAFCLLIPQRIFQQRYENLNLNGILKLLKSFYAELVYIRSI